MPFEVHLQKIFIRQDVVTNWHPEEINLPVSLSERIDEFWQTEIEFSEKSNYIFNGELCSLLDWSERHQKLVLDLGRTNYKRLLYSNRIRSEATEETNGLFNPKAVGVSVVILSAEEQIIMMRRSASVGEGPNALDVFGGHIGPEEHVDNNKPDPFVAIAAEIKEEIGVTVSNVDDLLCLGIIESSFNKKTELIFRYESRLTSRNFFQAAAKVRSPEISSVFTIPNNRVDLEFFLQQNHCELSASAFGALWLHLQTFKDELK